MGKKITAIMVAIMVTVGMTGMGYAAKCKGTVESIDAGKMVIQLKGKCKAKAGDEVKIKTKKKVAVEGC